MSRPVFNTERVMMNIKGAKHPCLNESFIANDVFMEDKSIFFITGPNMGGKSTTLRMVCLAAVLG